MPIKKSELYSSLWKSCDELRGGMDASQYKDYVLVLLFMKYVSDKASSQKGYLLDVPKGGSFADMVVLKGDKEKATSPLSSPTWTLSLRHFSNASPRPARSSRE
jgi:type I restriction-modification system DNA methylase subunit